MLKNFVVFVVHHTGTASSCFISAVLAYFCAYILSSSAKETGSMCGELSAPENRSVAKKKELRRCFLFSPLMVLDIP